VRFALAAVVVVAVACGGAQRPNERPEIRVLDRGAEPRRDVRLQPALHKPERVELTIKMRSTGAYTDTTLETSHSMLDYPSISARERVEATDVDNSNLTLVTAVIEDVHVLDDVVDRRIKPIVAKRVASLRNATVAWRLAPDGSASAVDSELRNLPPGLLQAFVNAPTFPSSPVGVGARWTETVPTVLGGIHWNQTRTYTLTALDDSYATLSIELSATAGSQALSVEPNATIRLTSGTMSMTGTATIPLHGLAWTGDSRGSIETNLQIVRGHLRTESTVSTEILSSSKPVHD
jgi:hypothetical protein